MLHVHLGRFGRVMRGMMHVSLRRVRVIGRRFVIAHFVVHGGLTMVPGRVFMVLGRF
jgi:hypothetical protein